MAEITQLIDKLDTFEIVRNKIALILATESAMQVQLAFQALPYSSICGGPEVACGEPDVTTGNRQLSAGSKDPSLWAFKTYIERATPWDDYTPDSIIVNVWYDTASIDESASSTVRSQTMRGTFNIDVIGFGVSKPNGSGGQVPGDEKAALNSQRGLRLVRNIIMASNYTYLGLRGLVGQRMPQSISSFQPQLNSNPTDHAVGTRLSLGVRYEEFSPQYEPAILQELGVVVERAEDGLVLFELEYNYPL